MKKRVIIKSVVDADKLNWLIINILVKIKQVKMVFTAFVKNVEIQKEEKKRSNYL